MISAFRGTENQKLEFVDIVSNNSGLIYGLLNDKTVVPLNEPTPIQLETNYALEFEDSDNVEWIFEYNNVFIAYRGEGTDVVIWGDREEAAELAMIIDVDKKHFQNDKIKEIHQNSIGYIALMESGKILTWSRMSVRNDAEFYDGDYSVNEIKRIGNRKTVSVHTVDAGHILLLDDGRLAYFGMTNPPDEIEEKEELDRKFKEIFVPNPAEDFAIGLAANGGLVGLGADSDLDKYSLTESRGYAKYVKDNINLYDTVGIPEADVNQHFMDEILSFL